MGHHLILSRREFIKAASAAGCLLPLSGVSHLAWGNSATSAGLKPNPLLVTVFLRGGADGLNLVSPVNDADFIDARPADLRVLDSGTRAGFLLEQTEQADIGFYLHHEAPGLADLYRAKQLAVIHAVGIKDGTRSHEEAQAMIERGSTSARHDRHAQAIPGWMSRSVATNKQNPRSIQSASIPAYSASTITPLSLEGINNALITPDLNAGLNVPWGKPTFDLLREISTVSVSATASATASQTPIDAVRLAMTDALRMQDNINQSIARDATGKVLPYQASGSANYDGAGELARSFSSIARLAKMNVGLQVANVDFGGWDNHENQSGHFANIVRQLSKGLSAFYEDMSAGNHSVSIIVMTEFGRRVRSNKSNGTDHGHGACWFALGDRVQGGNLFGKWPGLSSKEMDQGLDLQVTTDYRQVLFETLRTSHLDTQQALPDFSSGRSLGLFS